MALSQKHSGKILTPWYNSHEWKLVYKFLYSSDKKEESYHKALKILRIWKRRMPLLSSGVEGTLIILEALLCNHDDITDILLANIYGTALMRFLNLCAANNEKQGTFYETARKNKIPEWMIDLRHNFAHSHDLPRIEILKVALEYALDWLYDAYWSVQNSKISDWILEDSTMIDKLLLESLFSALCSASLKVYHNEQLDPKEYFKLFLTNENYGKEINVKNLQNVVLRRLRQEFYHAIKTHLVNVLIEKGNILEELNVYKEIEGEQYITKEFLTCWENILVYLYDNKLIVQFWEVLYNMSHNTSRDPEVLWIKETVIAVLRQKLLKQKKLEKNTMDIMESNIPNSVLNFKHYNNVLLPELNSFIQNMLSNPKKKILIFLRPLLQIGGFEEDYIEDMEKLLKAYLIPSPSTSLSELNDKFFSLPHTEEKMEIEDAPQEEVVPVKKMWRRVDGEMYKCLPIGVVPGKSREINPLSLYNKMCQ